MEGGRETTRWRECAKQMNEVGGDTAAWTQHLPESHRSNSQFDSEARGSLKSS